MKQHLRQRRCLVFDETEWVSEWMNDKEAQHCAKWGGCLFLAFYTVPLTWTNESGLGNSLTHHSFAHWACIIFTLESGECDQEWGNGGRVNAQKPDLGSSDERKGPKKLSCKDWNLVKNSGNIKMVANNADFKYPFLAIIINDNAKNHV